MNDHQAKEAFDFKTNSPSQHFKKCIENSMENMHTDVRESKVKEDISEGINNVKN